MQVVESVDRCVPSVSTDNGFRGDSTANDVIFFRLHSPEWTARSSWSDRIIGCHSVAPGHGELPYTKSLVKHAFDVLGGLACLDRIEAPTVTIEYLRRNKRAWFTPDLKVEFSFLPECLAALGVVTRGFYVHVQPLKFVDSFNPDPAYLALQRATGLSVLQLTQVELLWRREEVFHG